MNTRMKIKKGILKKTKKHYCSWGIRMKENLLNRKTYKAVKKMDRQEMESFFKDIYRSGFQDGADVGNNADFRIQLSEVLNNTKGIGIKLYDRIMKTAKEMEI